MAMKWWIRENSWWYGCFCRCLLLIWMSACVKIKLCFFHLARGDIPQEKWKEKRARSWRFISTGKKIMSVFLSKAFFRLQTHEHILLPPAISWIHVHYIWKWFKEIVHPKISKFCLHFLTLIMYKTVKQNKWAKLKKIKVISYSKQNWTSNCTHTF